MTKADFIEKINEKVEGLPKGKAEEALNAIVTILKDALTKKEEVILNGFGLTNC
ncbi:MAG: HU family DNA-binding protein [Desulfovibrionaceae bacterium]|nr:HU family DNA-binding protein [Desulfovibrionaceae bacterium]